MAPGCSALSGFVAAKPERPLRFTHNPLGSADVPQALGLRSGAGAHGARGRVLRARAVLRGREGSEAGSEARSSKETKGGSFISSPATGRAPLKSSGSTRSCCRQTGSLTDASSSSRVLLSFIETSWFPRVVVVNLKRHYVTIPTLK
ncbi:hypothetical protein EYF80_028694 [Liparis tanakae]|uniref:Uncharacterized protein n=1 Tax=Liparis tanakae TaxID=230148 RepID=A0A4Z2H5X1_9TELE|nr:hypothetical protein EYF80_028694 [Liparis tanakae]